MSIMKLFSNFIILSLIGFICECIVCGLINEKSNKGLRGPWCPIYGFAGILMLELLMPLKKYFGVVYIVGVILSSIIEYIISYLLEKIYRIRWWDYSHLKFNLNGRIHLVNCLLFGILSVLLIYIFNPLVIKFYNFIPQNVFIICVLIVVIIFIIDAIVSIVEAFGLAKRIAVVKNNFIYNLKTESEKTETLKYYFDKLRFAFNPKRLINNYPNMKIDEPSVIELLKNYYKNHSKK